MKIFLGLVALILFVSSAYADDRRNYISVEYAPWSEHLSDSDAPANGYNETNNIVTVKYGRVYPVNNEWSYSLSVGVTAFENSYYKDSQGAGVGIEGLYDWTPYWNLYGGADLGLVSGYEDNVDADYHLFGDLVPFMVFNGGAEYDFDEDLPTLRTGMKYVPASLFDSDDVVVFAFGTRYRF